MTRQSDAAIKIAQHPRVESAEWNEVLYAVVLKPGWRDSGMTTGEHTIIDNRVNEVMRAVRAAVPCDCERRCVNATH